MITGNVINVFRFSLSLPLDLHAQYVYIAIFFTFMSYTGQVIRLF